MSGEWPLRTTDPRGREVVFDGSGHLHLVRRKREDFLEQTAEILEAVARPDFREEDPIPGRERFFRRGFDGREGWLLVVVDFTEAPAWVVTAFITYSDPRRL